MNAKIIAENIFWVGKVDDRKVPFHRLILERGTTYNSYLLKTECPTVIDTVDIEFGKEYVNNLSKEINPLDIQYIVINHVEPDHAGALPALAAKAVNARIVTTELGAELLKDMFRLHKREFLVVSDGDSLDIGGKTLRFFETPYLHTEETMITYAEEDGILFPCDLFSTHIASEDLFNDEAKAEYIEDFKVYYKLIMGPHRPYVRKMLEKLKNLDIKMIAPSHGYILRENAGEFIKIYDQMSSLENSRKHKKVAVVFASMTGNTGKIAERLAKGLEESGVKAAVLNLKDAAVDQVKKIVSESDGVLVGSSTRYADMVGNVEELLKSLEPDKDRNRLAGAFGSFGWSGEAIMHIEDYLNKAGYTVVNQRYILAATGVDVPAFPLRVRFARQEGLNLAEEAGRIFGEQVLTF